MGTVQEATLTLAEAARRLGLDIDDLLGRIYRGELPAVAERSSGRLLISASDVERMRTH
jgi:hypothetical protein